MVDENQAVEDYKETLTELNANSKPHINMLTMLAEENSSLSSKIAQVIESHIQKVSMVQKLPALYLIDSIVKNCVDTNYKDMFARNIIATFVQVFKEADEKTRQSMFKLRQTWAGIFPASRLYGIDLKVSQIDPAWPITAPQQLKTQDTPSSTIHVNPAFLKKQEQQNIAQRANSKESVNSSSASESVSKGESRLQITESELKRLMNKKDQLEKTMTKAQNDEKLTKVRQQPHSVVTRPTDPRKRIGGSSTEGQSSEKRSRAEKERGDSSGSSDDRKSKKRWIDRYRREEKDSEEDRSDSRETSPDRKKGKSHKSRNYRKGSGSPSPHERNDTKQSRTSSPSAVPVKSKHTARTLPPKKRIRSDEEVNTEGSGEDLCVSHSKSDPQPLGTGNRDEDLRLLLQQSPPRERRPQQNRIPKVRDRQTHPPRLPHPSTTTNFDTAPPPTSLPGSHAFVTTGAPPARPLLTAPVAPMIPRFPMRPPPPQIQNMDVKPPDPIPANNRIFVDGKAYEVKYIEDIPVIEKNGQPHKIYFTGPPRDVVIDGVAYSLAFGDKKTVMIDGQPHVIRFGAPGRELYMGSYPFRGAFGGPLIFATINGNRHELRLCGPPPEVKIEPEPCYELIPRMPRYPRRGGPVHDFGYSDPPRPQVATEPGSAQQLNPHLDLSGLLKNLVTAGVIPGSKESTKADSRRRGAANKEPHRPPTPPIPSGQHFKDEEEVERQTRPPPNLKDMSMRVLRIRYGSVIESLYPTKQTCPNCGMRFEDMDEQRYRRHLDWHFKENARAKDTSRGASRPWYFAAEDWLNYTEQGDDPATKSKSAVFEGSVGTESAENGDAASSEQVAPAVSEQTACSVCGETFDNFYDDDEDTWKCRNAVMVGGKMFHPVCYQDASLVQSSASDPAFLVQAEVSYSVPPGLDVLEEAEREVKTEPRVEFGDRSVLSEINTGMVGVAESRESGKVIDEHPPVPSDSNSNLEAIHPHTAGLDKVKVEVEDSNLGSMEAPLGSAPSLLVFAEEEGGGTPVRDEVDVATIPESLDSVRVRERSPGTPLRDEMD